MTDKEIKQNAEEYANSMYDKQYQSELWKECYTIHIAGSHSRDEEVKRLYNRLEHFRSIINNLRNPWISVEDSLLQESKKYKGWLSDTVFVMTNKNDGTSARYDHATKTWCPAKILQGSITHWMPIPEV